VCILLCDSSDSHPMIRKAPFQRSDTIGYPPSSPKFVKLFPRTQTIEFAPSVTRRRGRADTYVITEEQRPSIEQRPSDPSKQFIYFLVKRKSFSLPSKGSIYSRRPSMNRPPSVTTHATGYTTQTRHTSSSAKNRGLGGFPMPHVIVSRFLDRFFPNLGRKLARTVTMPRTTSLVSQRPDIPDGAKSVPYITFDAVVGRNSTFRLLTREQWEELGGVEYRALNALLWIVAGVCSPPFLYSKRLTRCPSITS